MGKFREITDLIEHAVPEFKSLRVIPRGVPYYPDTMMKGEVRFGRRLGNNLSVLNADNEVSLEADAFIQDVSLTLSRSLLWWEYGALLSFNGVEMYELREWDSLKNTVTFSNPLSSNRFAGDKVYLWATPTPVHALATQGSVQLTVKSKHPILNGDVITFPTSEILSSLVEIKVKIANQAGPSLDPDYPTLYTLVLEDILPQDLDTTSLCYIRAYPGYRSGDIKVPKVNYGQMGPFLVDYIASPLDSVVKYEETFAIKTFDGGSTPIVGDLNSFETIYKNYAICDRPLWADCFLFWDVVKGSSGFSLPNKYKLITDAEGKGHVFKKIVPELPSGKTWEFKITPSASGVLRVQFGPYAWQDFVLNANVQQTVQVTSPANGFIDEIHIVVNLSTPKSFIEMSNWTLKSSVVDTLQYTQVFKVLGSFNFQATSIILKPYFLSLSDLTINYDDGSQYNSGAIYL